MAAPPAGTPSKQDSKVNPKKFNNVSTFKIVQLKEPLLTGKETADDKVAWDEIEKKRIDEERTKKEKAEKSSNIEPKRRKKTTKPLKESHNNNDLSLLFVLRVVVRFGYLRRQL